jgi:hypothetical protein
MRLPFAAVVAIFLPFAAHSLTIVEGRTLRNDAGGIDAVGTDLSVCAPNAAYYTGPLAAGSEWVWVGDVETNDAAAFELVFDMTGYDVATAAVFGLWGVDNVGTVSLNGQDIASLASGWSSFGQLHEYGSSVPDHFRTGLNRLRFSARDQGGPGALQATAIVTADALPESLPAGVLAPAVPVPLPAGAMLLLTGLGVLGVRAMRARRG